MVDIDIFQSMVDFGLVVLIWLVQIIIYPFFAVADKSIFHLWHSKYMRQITFFVAPLMFIQTALATYQLSETPSLINILILLLILSLWIHTFMIAVPVHNQLTQKGNVPELARRLVRINWYRTVIWTMIWLIGSSELIR